MLRRRELIASLLGMPATMLGGCGGPSVPPSGRLISPDLETGHRIRDGFRPQPIAGAAERARVIIVGGGTAGLSAAWRLRHAGIDDFVVLELDDDPGGTARGGSTNGFAYPWGAHYVPVPMAEQRGLIELLREMDVVQRVAPDGTPTIAEQCLCRDPQERVFYQDHWYEGLYPEDGADAGDLREVQEFQQEIWRWVAKRDSQGRRLFTIPMSRGSDDAEARALDRESMSDWMDRHGWLSPRLRWLVDYSCRDDYGLTAEQTSAWAGLFYFTSRIKQPGDESQPVITWPEGNGAIVDHLVRRCEPNLRTGHAVTEITSDRSGSSVRVIALDKRAGRAVQWIGDRVIFAAPQFLASRVIDGFGDRGGVSAAFRYGSWVVANVHVDRRPRETGFPMCWDNVIYGSKSLGYVTSTHQIGIDHGPTVLTWYYPITAVDPKIPRQQLLSMRWSDWAEVVLSDLSVPHPEIRSLVSRLDLMRWGHAMVQPRVGFVWSDARRNASRPLGRVHFAGTDLSGVALMEEAFSHGIRAAEETLRDGQATVDSML